MRASLVAAVLAASLLPGCYAPLKLARDDSATVLSTQLLDAPDPGQPGPYRVRYLTYGSGTDKRRAAYRDSVAFRTKSVDASKLVDLGESAKSRNKYWGFTPKAFPLNARVWYPDGPGPFPLVLIVHGNHDMKKFSDPGYAYLGELLASRGFIVASIDENFLNGRIRGENDARAWLLLKHLEAWRGFVADEKNPFYRKADLDRVALIGHSRGGEAVGHAAAFNRLPRYPDDATLTFDFGFGIRGVVAIAPVDGQYTPADRLEPDVKNVDYLVFHGSHDGDVSSFMGLRQYQRVRFDDGRPHFKAAVYVYRANHGQWNTTWGNKDDGPRSSRILDLRGLLPPEEQRRFAKVYIGAFLEATLHDDRRYLPLFRDHRVAGGWLPKTMYITRFQESGYRALADFDEDVDVTTGTAPGVRIRGDSLATWREGGLNLRTANSPAEGSSLNEYAVWLGWNNRLAGEDTTRMGPPASYTLSLPDTLARAWALGPGSSLQLLLMPTEKIPGPRKPPHADTAKADEAGKRKRDATPKQPPRLEDLPPVDLSVELEDAAGATARLPLSRYGAIRRPLEMRVLRRADQEKRAFARPYEYVMQTFSLPLADFVEATPSLDLTRLRAVRLVFDRSPAGTVIVDDIGFSTGDAGYRVARGDRP
ncbi:MAG: MFS transporter [Gemmatimonadetes bacterium]|nr:MFS transporter [Gemmatimonadota bacterium]